jgi:adenylate kinase family enzyme
LESCKEGEAITAKRIVVYGVTGSGKSVLAERIAKATGLPYVAVDDLTWRPGWVVVPYDEQRALFTEICDGEAWVLDSAYGHWIEIPLARVEVIVALDYPRWFSFARLLKRTFTRLFDRRPICNGNRENLRLIFSRDSILVWHFRSWRRKRERIRAWMAEGRPVVWLRTPREAEKWLRALE